MLTINKINSENEKPFKTELKNLIQIFSSAPIFSKTQVKDFFFNSVVLKRSNFTRRIKNSRVYLSFFLDKQVFKQSKFLFLKFYSFFKKGLTNQRIINLSIKPEFSQKLHFCFLLLNRQKQKLLNFYVEFLLFDFSKKSNNKNLVNFIQLRQKFQTKNLAKNLLEIQPSGAMPQRELIRNKNFQMKHSYNFSRLAMPVLNNYLQTSLMTYTGQYWFKNELSSKKEIFLNLDLNSKIILKNMKTKPQKRVKRISLKIKNQIHNFEYLSLYLNDFYLFEFLKKFYKLVHHSTNQNLVKVKKLFYKSKNLKKKFFLTLLPTMSIFILRNDLSVNLLVDKTKIEEKISFLLKKNHTFLKNNRLTFYFLKQIFYQFYYFELTRIFAFYKTPIFLNNYCFELLTNKVCQPFNFTNLELDSFFKKKNLYFSSLKILNVIGKFKTNNATLFSRFLLNITKNGYLINFNKEPLQLINLKYNDPNLLIYLKLLRLSQLSIEKKNSYFKKQESISNQKTSNFRQFLIKNNITEPFKIIQKFSFNFIKKTNLVFFVDLYVEKDFFNNLQSRQDEILARKNYISLSEFNIILITKETYSFCFFKNNLVFEQLKKCFFLLKNWCSETFYCIKYMQFQFSLSSLLEKNMLSKPKSEPEKFLKISSLKNNPLFHLEETQNAILFSDISLFFKTPVDFKSFKYLCRLKNCIKYSSTKKQELLIQTLTPKIFACCYHYRFISNQRLFIEFDKNLTRFLWRWTCRRHNNKSKKWIKSKYFYQINEKHWIFGTTLSNSFFPLSLQENFLDNNLSSNNASIKISSVLLVYLPWHAQIYLKLKTVA